MTVNLAVEHSFKMTLNGRAARAIFYSAGVEHRAEGTMSSEFSLEQLKAMSPQEIVNHFEIHSITPDPSAVQAVA